MISELFPSAPATQILEFMMNNPMSLKSHISIATGQNHSRVTRWLKYYIEQGVLRCDRKGRIHIITWESMTVFLKLQELMS